MISEYYIYIIKCRDGRLYTGITTDIKRRFSEHSTGEKGAKFTRANPPEEIMTVWSCNGRSYASKLEYAIKKLNRQQKIKLINEELQLSDFMDKDISQSFNREYDLIS